MAKDDILVSKKHGVNPSLMKCFFCGEAKGVALLGKLRGDKEAPKQGVYDYEPCDKCAEYMKQDILLVVVKDGESGDNPYRTGHQVVVKEEKMLELVTDEAITKAMLKQRFLFIEETTAKQIGLVPPEESKDGV